MFINRFRPIAGKTNLPEPRNLSPRREMPVRQAPRHVNPREAGSTTGEVMGYIVCGAVGTTVGVMGFSAAHYVIKAEAPIEKTPCGVLPAKYSIDCGGHYHNNYDKEFIESLTNPAFAYEHVLELAVENPFSISYAVGALGLFSVSLTMTFLVCALAEKLGWPFREF